MSLRIYFNPRNKQFNLLTKKAFTQFNKEQVSNQNSLTLNQFRELAARFFGYNSKHELESTTVADSKHHNVITELSQVDELHILELMTRIKSLWHDDALFKKLSDSDILVGNVEWRKIASALESELIRSSNQARNVITFYVATSPGVDLFGDNITSSIAQKLTEILGTTVRFRPSPTCRYFHPICNLMDLGSDTYQTIYEDSLPMVDNMDIYANTLDVAIEVKEVWFEFDSNDADYYDEYFDRLNCSLDDIGNLLDPTPTHQLVTLCHYRLSSGKELINTENAEYYEQDKQTLKTLALGSRNPETPKTLQIVNGNRHVGYVVFNSNSARLFLPTFDKLEYEMGDRDRIMSMPDYNIGSITDDIENIEYYDVAELESVQLGLGIIDKPIREIPDLGHVLHSKIKRNSSLLGGNVIAMPRYAWSSWLLNKNPLTAYDEDYDDYLEINGHEPVSGDDVLALSFPTSSVIQNLEGNFMLQTKGDNIDDDCATATLTVTKIISHYDGSVGLIIASVYDEDNICIASESFSIYNFNDKAPFAGGDDCPIEAALVALANKYGWDVAMVECEYQWYQNRDLGPSVFASVPILKIPQTNTRHFAVSVLTHEHVSNITEQQRVQIAKSIKRVLLKYTPHKVNEDGERHEIVNIDVKAVSRMHYVGPILDEGQEVFLDFLTTTCQQIQNVKETGSTSSNLGTHEPISGPVTLFFTMTGSRRDTDEVYVNLSHVFMTQEVLSAFGANVKESRIRGEISSDFAVEKDEICLTLGVNSQESKIILHPRILE